MIAKNGPSIDDMYDVNMRVVDFVRKMMAVAHSGPECIIDVAGQSHSEGIMYSPEYNVWFTSDEYEVMGGDIGIEAVQ
jgi:hypothetical protein